MYKEGAAQRGEQQRSEKVLVKKSAASSSNMASGDGDGAPVDTDQPIA